MPAVDQTITHWKGDSGEIRIAVKDQDGNVVDLTDATARWWMGKNVAAGGADVYVKKGTSDGGIVITSDTDGLFTLVIELLPSDTETIVSTGIFYHECEVVSAAGEVSTVTTGKFILKPTLIPDVL